MSNANLFNPIVTPSDEGPTYRPTASKKYRDGIASRDEKIRKTALGIANVEPFKIRPTGLYAHGLVLQVVDADLTSKTLHLPPTKRVLRHRGVDMHGYHWYFRQGSSKLIRAGSLSEEKEYAIVPEDHVIGEEENVASGLCNDGHVVIRPDPRPDTIEKLHNHPGQVYHVGTVVAAGDDGFLLGDRVLYYTSGAATLIMLRNELLHCLKPYAVIGMVEAE